MQGFSPRALPSRVYLTGFMGSGKSSVGPLVAQALGYDFLDLDTAIEAQAGRPIQEIFEDAGEASFRALEAALLRETTEQRRVVVALGGGALTVEENLTCALQHGLVVYLNVASDELVRRLRRAAAERPLLQDASGRPLPLEALHATIEQMLATREPFYRRAHVVVGVEHQTIEQTARDVLEALRGYKAPRAD